MIFRDKAMTKGSFQFIHKYGKNILLLLLEEGSVGGRRGISLGEDLTYTLGVGEGDGIVIVVCPIMFILEYTE